MTDDNNTHQVGNSPEPWFPRRRASESQRRPSESNRRPSTLSIAPSEDRGKNPFHWWKFTLRPWDDDQEADWWFASTAIPLIAAALGPLANVLSIAALVTSWRMCLVDGVDPAVCPFDGDGSTLLPDLSGYTYHDPDWYDRPLHSQAQADLSRCYNLNVVSLVAGFVGNLFLLFNFTGRVRYIIALPVTILMWYIATGIVSAWLFVLVCHRS